MQLVGAAIQCAYVPRDLFWFVIEEWPRTQVTYGVRAARSPQLSASGGSPETPVARLPGSALARSRRRRRPRTHRGTRLDRRPDIRPTRRRGCALVLRRF